MTTSGVGRVKLTTPANRVNTGKWNAWGATPEQNLYGAAVCSVPSAPDTQVHPHNRTHQFGDVHQESPLPTSDPVFLYGPTDPGAVFLIYLLRNPHKIGAR